MASATSLPFRCVCFLVLTLLLTTLTHGLMPPKPELTVSKPGVFYKDQLTVSCDYPRGYDFRWLEIQFKDVTGSRWLTAARLTDTGHVTYGSSVDSNLAEVTSSTSRGKHNVRVRWQHNAISETTIFKCVVSAPYTRDIERTDAKKVLYYPTKLYTVRKPALSVTPSSFQRGELTTFTLTCKIPITHMVLLPEQDSGDAATGGDIGGEPFGTVGFNDWYDASTGSPDDVNDLICPPGYTLFEADAICYKAMPEMDDRWNGESQCFNEDPRAKLVMPKTSRQVRFVENLLREEKGAGNEYPFWLFTSSPGDGTYEWADQSSKLRSSQWAPGQPTPDGNGCTVYYKDGIHSPNCGLQGHIICQVPAEVRLGVDGSDPYGPRSDIRLQGVTLYKLTDDGVVPLVTVDSDSITDPELSSQLLQLDSAASANSSPSASHHDLEVVLTYRDLAPGKAINFQCRVKYLDHNDEERNLQGSAQARGSD